MQNEHLQIITGDKGTAEVIIREVNKVNELEVKPPIKINISGTIDAPYEFLSKRISEADQIDQKHCHIIVNKEDLYICLYTSEHDQYKNGSIKGSLELYPKFREFGINNFAKGWSPTELGLFIKMNRSFFPNKAQNMKLVTALMNFKATIDHTIEQSLKENGNRTDNFAQVVNSNLPASFTLVIPVFKGMPPETIEVETFASINGRDVAFVLISPAAEEIVETLRNKAIYEQIAKIREIAPDIAIIEQ